MFKHFTGIGLPQHSLTFVQMISKTKLTLLKEYAINQQACIA